MTAANGGSTVVLSGGTIPASGSCAVTVNVTSATAASYANTIPIGAVTTTNAGPNAVAANATLSVLASLTAVKTFVPATIGLNGTSVLTITLTNPNATAVTNAAFTDTYPSGLVNTASASGATTCAGGSVTTANGGTSLALAGATVPANGSCAVTVNVTSATAATYLNNTGTISTDTGTAASASGSLAVLSSPIVTKAFAPTSVGLNSPAVLTITLTNPNATAVTGAAFTDTYPSGLVKYSDTGGCDDLRRRHG